MGGLLQTAEGGSGLGKRLSRLFTASLSDLNPLRGEEPYLAVDIGSSTIKVVEVRGKVGHLRVLNAATLPTPAGAIQNNMVFETDAVAEAVKALRESCGIRARKVITAVPGPAVIIKRVTLPVQTSQELENTILFEAGNFIPEDLDNVNLDYQVTDYLEDGKRMEVLLVAAKKDIVASYSETVRAAGLLPVLIDVDYFCLENMFEVSYEPPETGAIALVNIGARYSSINIMKAGRSTFTGDVPVGGRDLSEALMRDLGVDAERAEVLKAGGAADDDLAEQVAGVLEAGTASLIDEIHHALSFFWTAATDETIDKVYLSGGMARMPGFAQQLSERVQAPVEIANPFANVEIDRQVDTPALRQQAPEFAVAMGLAIRRPDDK
ncbi:pilus assembly protein PilM [Candidatus Binatia bacterium]|nr:pilus assembly protein PilM [Candidatus Binatia bacterium]